VLTKEDRAWLQRVLRRHRKKQNEEMRKILAELITEEAGMLMLEQMTQHQKREVQ
jgi:ribosomal protein S3AE